MSTAIVVTSGGMDSTVALYVARADHDRVVALSFDYGQRHRKELACAAELSRDLGVEHHTIDLTGITSLIATSALTDPDHDVPEGHYAADTMAQTVVPNRNALMANIGIAVAVSEGAVALYLGIHAGDHAVYPDCRPVFVEALEHLALVANDGFLDGAFRVVTPFLHSTKADIAAVGHQLGVPFSKTWTCYKGEDVACGRCSTCVERLEAFDLAGLTDPLDYSDRAYWRSVVTN